MEKEVFFTFYTQNNLSEKYFPTKNFCERTRDQNRPYGYVRGVDSKSKKVLDINLLELLGIGVYSPGSYRVCFMPPGLCYSVFHSLITRSPGTLGL
jgi:hypothetical protein